MKRGLIVATAVLAMLAPLAGVAGGLSSTPTESADLDLVYIDSNNNLKYVDGDDNVVDTGVQATDVGGAADFDDDGEVEVAFIDDGSTASLKYTDANGAVTNLLGSGPLGSVGGVGDWDGDGDPDVLYSDGGELRYVDDGGNNYAVGEFAAGDPRVSNVAEVGDVADIDGDGGLEVAIATSGDDLTYAEPGATTTTLFAGDVASAGAAADVDGDNTIEIVFDGVSNGDIALAEPDGSVATTGITGGAPGGAGDIDADGTVEFGIVAVSDVIVGESNGDTTTLGPDDPRAVGAMVDFDDDGAYDEPPTASNASPSSTTVSSDPVTLSVDVADDEFAVGDEVQVDIDHEGNDIKTTNITSNQTVTADVQDVQDGTRSWSVALTDAGGNSNSYSYTYTADYAAPNLSNPDPTGNISSYDGDISINVTDADFPDGDTVTVNATDGDGDQISQTTVSSNQTVSFDYVVKAGANNITWSATDSHQLSDSAAQDFDGPTFLAVRNESDPDTIINTSSNVTATFFAEGSETVVKKSSDTGRFDFTGLPAAKRYVVSVDAEGYRPRQVVIDSLFEQQSVYLLPENATAATVEFQLNDQTGRFASESTTLFVEIPLTRNNSTEYRTAFADQFGATDSLRVDLRDETRYRIKVRNDQGETRVLESYTTAGDAIAPLTIGQVGVSGEIGDRGVAFAATVVETDTGRALRIVYRDPEQLTDNVEIGVERNGSDYVPNTTGTAGYGRYITTIPIDNSTPDNATFNVTYAALRDGATIYGQTQAGAVGELDFGVASQPLSLLGWMLTIGLTSMVIIRTPRLAPATGTATASMLTIAGVLAVPAPALGISGAISVLAVAGRGGGQ